MLTSEYFRTGKFKENYNFWFRDEIVAEKAHFISANVDLSWYKVGAYREAGSLAGGKPQRYILS